MSTRALRHRLSLCVVAWLIFVSGSANAQAPWEARVTTTPNPLPAGRCAAIWVEVVDDNGYRRTQLQDGRAVDSRTFTYASSDTTSFRWRNGNPREGYVCTEQSARAATTTITVTLPDGTVGKVDLAITPAGQTAPATVFRAQAPLWRPGLTGKAIAGSARSAAQASVAAALHTVVVQPLSLTGNYFTLAAQSVAVAPLSLTGNYFVLAAQSVAVSQLSLTGNYFVLAAQTIAVPPLSLTGTAAAMVRRGAPVHPPTAARTTTPPAAH